jgi:putative acetyltransferase
MTIALRLATISDAEAIARLHRDAVDGYAGVYDLAALDAWREGHTGRQWEARIQGRGLFVLADREGELLGCGGLVDNRTGLYVHPRAQRCGVARSIFLELEARARERGLALLELSAPEGAVPFYEAVGFERVGPSPHRFGNGAEITVVDMRKRLAMMPR